MADDIFEKKQKEAEAIKKQLVTKDLKKLNKKLKSKKYTTESIVADSPLSGVYHNLIDEKDKIDSKLQKNYNKTYNDINTLIYKINQKIDDKTRLIDYKINRKQDEIKNKIKRELI